MMPDIEKLTDDRKKLIGDESKLLENHRKANKERLTRHFYDMSNMMSRNEGVWLSNGWAKVLLWVFLPSMLYIILILDWLFCHIIHRKIRTKAKSTGKSVNLAFERNKSLQSYFILMTLTIHLSILL